MNEKICDRRTLLYSASCEMQYPIQKKEKYTTKKNRKIISCIFHVHKLEEELAYFSFSFFLKLILMSGFFFNCFLKNQPNELFILDYQC